MTSVRSRLPRLNGNKLNCGMAASEQIMKYNRRMQIILAIFIVLLANSCATSQKTDRTYAEPVFPKKPTVNDTTVKKPAPEDTLPEKKVFDIALILPLYLNEITAEVDSGETDPGIKQSLLGVEFYNGVRLALDSLEKLGLQANMRVYDDRNDVSHIRSIVFDEGMKNVDLVIGPVYNNNLRAISGYALRDSFYLVSPLSPAADITTQNPYFIMVNPAIEVHAKKIFDHIVNRHKNDNIILFTRLGNVEDEYANIFRELLKQYHLETNKFTFQFTEINYQPEGTEGAVTISDRELRDHFDENANNIVIIPSFDKAFMHSISRRLYGLNERATSYGTTERLKENEQTKITIYGLPSWGNEEGLRIDYLSALNVHFTSAYWMPPDFYSEENNFYKAYVEKFNTEPSEYAVKGFDLMMYFGTLLNKHGQNFPQMMLQEKFKANHTSFNFGIRAVKEIPTVSLEQVQPPKTDFIENKYVHLLKYDGYSIKKVE